MKTLKGFYKEYLDWVNAGAPQNQPFNRSVGLCANLTRYTEITAPLLIEMSKQFRGANLERAYPFGGELAYNEQSSSGTQHLNHMRIEWVIKHANE